MIFLRLALMAKRRRFCEKWLDPELETFVEIQQLVQHRAVVQRAVGQSRISGQDPRGRRGQES